MAKPRKPISEKSKAVIPEKSDSGITDNQMRWQMNELIYNAITSRSQMMQRLMDPRRNLDDECGYKQPSQITIDDYQREYDANEIASRVVHCLPEETWKTQPCVYEVEDADTETEFELAWKDLGKSLIGPESNFRQEEGSPIWEYLLRADIQSGIGFYGVLLIGTDDGGELMEPMTMRSGAKITYMRVFPHKLAQISALDNDVTSPRYGKPVSYNLQTYNPDDITSDVVGTTAQTVEVHWSRVIHIADNLGSNEIFGIPRMRPVFRRLVDLAKLYGGSAEMYWKGAFPGLSFETHPQLGTDVDLDPEEVRTAVEYYQNGLQRFFAIEGISAKSLAPQVVDPSAQIDKHIEAICIRLGIPKRIFMGSERGELASSQDDDTWEDRLKFRRWMYAVPRIIVPFVEWCITYGVLPKPPEGYCVDWSDEKTMRPTEQADVLLKKTQAMAAYVGGSVDQLVAPAEYFTEFMGMDYDEAENLIDAAEEHVDEKQAVEDERAIMEADQQDERDIAKAKEFAKINPAQSKAPIVGRNF